MATKNEYKIINETLLEYLSTPGMEKKAVNSFIDFTRTRVREEGGARKILPPEQIKNSDLTRQVDTDLPVVVVDKEPDQPPAMSVPFATQPITHYIVGPRYKIHFDRIFTRKFTKDVDELRTWMMDIRQVISDNAIKDMLAEEDTKFISAINTMLVGPNQVVPATGVVQWETISGGIRRNTLLDAFKILPRTPSRCEVDTVLINNISIREVQKWGRDEMGGDFSEDLIRYGWSEREFMNARWLITIKREIVPDDTIFMFAKPQFIGKHFILEDTTMYIKREAFMLEYYCYQTSGMGIGNMASITRADFQ